VTSRDNKSYEEMISGNANHPDLTSTYCVHVLKLYTVPNKNVQVLHVNQERKRGTEGEEKEEIGKRREGKAGRGREGRGEERREEGTGEERKQKKKI
jgi:hypothetical protein